MTEFPYKLSCKIIDCLVEDGVCEMETVPSADAISRMIKKLITENNKHTKNTQQGGDVGKKATIYTEYLKTHIVIHVLHPPSTPLRSPPLKIRQTCALSLLFWPTSNWQMHGFVRESKLPVCTTSIAVYKFKICCCGCSCCFWCYSSCCCSKKSNKDLEYS